jgi:hypothetical protein
VFLFLTDDWLDEYGGHLEFWSRDLMRGGQRVLPSSGGLVLFSTSDFSYRGHPHPLSAPAGRVKRSFALYDDIAIRPTEDCTDGLCPINNDDCRHFEYGQSTLWQKMLWILSHCLVICSLCL